MPKRGLLLWIALVLAVLATSPARAHPESIGAPPAVLDAASSDPKVLGWMRGFPPPADKILRFSDGSSGQFPATRWSFSHSRELGPTRAVARGAGAPTALPRCERDLDDLTFTSTAGEAMTWAQALARTYADSIIVMHNGCVAYERYFGEGGPNQPHLAMSMTKSFVGVLAAQMVAQGKLDRGAPVTRYVPELGGAGYAGATVGDVMDMRVGVRFSEAYGDPKAEVWDYARAAGNIARGDYAGPRSVAEFLLKLRPEGPHGQAFAYKSVNTEVLAWIIKRVSGQSLSSLLSDVIWSQVGMENDAYFMLDEAGAETAAGGLNATARDVARFGEIIRLGGSLNGRQIIEKSAVDDLFGGGDRAQFAKAGYSTLPGWSYRDMWWISHDASRSIMARGVFGQNIFIDPAAKVVIVRFSSHPIASNTATDPIVLPAYAAVARALASR